VDVVAARGFLEGRELSRVEPTRNGFIA